MLAHLEAGDIVLANSGRARDVGVDNDGPCGKAVGGADDTRRTGTVEIRILARLAGLTGSGRGCLDEPGNPGARDLAAGSIG